MIHRHFLPILFNIKGSSPYFTRFDVFFTPTVVFLDHFGRERHRIEGYLPRREFAAQLEMALARLALVHQQWREAEDHYHDISERYADTGSAAEALYWSAVSHYKKSNDHGAFTRVSQQLAEKYPQSLWTKKASIWLPDQQTKAA